MNRLTPKGHRHPREGAKACTHLSEASIEPSPARGGGLGGGGAAAAVARESQASAVEPNRKSSAACLGRAPPPQPSPAPACGTAVRGIEIGCRRRFGGSLLSSWPAPEPAIHVAPRHGTTWIRGSSPRMTTSKDAQASPETRSRGGNTFPGQPCACGEREMKSPLPHRGGG